MKERAKKFHIIFQNMQFFQCSSLLETSHGRVLTTNFSSTDSQFLLNNLKLLGSVDFYLLTPSKLLCLQVTTLGQQRKFTIRYVMTGVVQAILWKQIRTLSQAQQDVGLCIALMGYVTKAGVRAKTIVGKCTCTSGNISSLKKYARSIFTSFIIG